MRNDIKILSEEEIISELKKCPGWVRKDNKITKEFLFDDFVGSLNFINQLLPFCEKMDHHPDVHIFYNKVVFELTRFDVEEKLTNFDFLVAQKIEDLYKNK